MMLGDRQYYTFLAGVPRLPRFDQSERLPIHRERLDRRLRLLAESDQRAIARITEFLTWRRPSSSDADFLAAGEQVLAETASAELREVVLQRVTLRVMITALRARRLGRLTVELRALLTAAPGVNGVRWDDPDLGQRQRYSWVPRARALLGQARELDQHLLEIAWGDLSRWETDRPFSLVASLAYVLKWDILERWLTYGANAARLRFETLAKEALGEQIPSFVA